MTPAQKLLQHYPDIDLLGLPLEAEERVPGVIDEFVAMGDTGDTLFNFLWNELSEEDVPIGELIGRLNCAIGDIETVREALKNV